MIVIPGKATPINFSITPHRLALWGVPAHFRIVEEGCRAKCSWRPILGLPPCVTAFRLVCRSFCFADKVLFALYHTPPPYKKSRGLGEVCEHSQIHGIFRPFWRKSARITKTNPQGISSSGVSFKSATTYFHAPFPANYLGHE